MQNVIVREHAHQQQQLCAHVGRPCSCVIMLVEGPDAHAPHANTRMLTHIIFVSGGGQVLIPEYILLFSTQPPSHSLMHHLNRHFILDTTKRWRVQAGRIAEPVWAFAFQLRTSGHEVRTVEAKDTLRGRYPDWSLMQPLLFGS